MNQLIILKDSTWLEKQLIAGKAVSSVLKHCNKLISDKTPNITLLDLEEESRKIIKQYDCIPTFEGYNSTHSSKPFPSALCISVNNVLVHGACTNYTLKEGDKVSVDLGATYDGVIADAAYTSIYGDCDPRMRDMLKACQKALTMAIEQVQVGKRIGIIGNTISKVARQTGFGLITRFGGHGIDLNKPHAQPFVANESLAKEGVRIAKGLTIAIEPMFTLDKTGTSTSEDGWSIISESIGCHFEHTIFVNDEITVVTEHGMLV